MCRYRNIVGMLYICNEFSQKTYIDSVKLGLGCYRWFSFYLLLTGFLSMGRIYVFGDKKAYRNYQAERRSALTMESFSKSY